MDSPDDNEKRRAQERKEWAIAIAVGVVAVLLIALAVFLSNMSPLWGF
jgi:hypothetical protein